VLQLENYKNKKNTENKLTRWSKKLVGWCKRKERWRSHEPVAYRDAQVGALARDSIITRINLTFDIGASIDCSYMACCSLLVSLMLLYVVP
jgi:hypothetical protein